MYCPVALMAVASMALHDANSSNKRNIVLVGPRFVVVLEDNGVQPEHLLFPKSDHPRDNIRHMHDCVREER